MAKLTLKDPIVLKIMISERGESIKGFAKKVGISQPYMSQVVNGKRNPSPVVGHNIAVNLGLKIEDIFFIETDNKSYQGLKEVFNMVCSNCGESIRLNDRFYRAGKNGSVFCSTKCSYEAFEGFYSKNEVDRTLERHTRNK